ncbi:MAG TPA: HAMP domain-containing sensor histidine kinase [Actinomycetes bacterium]|nr:HAMP domain-containing sensor histidine kinase [Actinomycetes bacterium]
MSPQRLYRLAAGSSIAFVVLFVAWVHGLGGSLAQAFDDLSITAAAFAAAFACLHSANRGQYGFGRAWTIALRRAWRLIGAGALSWAVGQLIWSLLDLTGGAGTAFPSPADAFFLAAIPLVGAGVISWPTAPVRALAQVRTLVDGLLIASSLLFASWALVLGPTYHAGGDSLLPRVIALVYPIGDLVLLTIAFSVLARARGRAIVQPALLTLAIVAMGTADSAFAYLAGKGAYATGAWLDLGWLTAWLVLGVAALRPSPAELLRGDDDEDVPVSWSRFWLPYVPPGIAFVTGTGVQVVKGQLEPFLVFNGAVIVLFVVARQVITNAENQRLHHRLRSTVDRLFQREAELETGLRREYAAADKMRAMSQMKDTFLRAVSHDLRTPLTAMHGVAVTLERTKLNLPRDQALDLIKMMIEKTRKMDRLLADLLDLNRMEEGILEPNRTLIDISALAHRVVDEVDQLRGWPIEIDAEPVRAAVDAPKVERIVENLLLNTTRHTPPGTQVWVRAHANERDLELIVEDAGPGVPAELAGTIFEPFRQGHAGAAAPPGKQGKGVGIGLSLVARFAQLHGGRAWVAERSGGGASFHVFLPGCVKRGDGTSQPEAAEPAEAAEAAEAGRSRPGVRARPAGITALDGSDDSGRRRAPETDLERVPRR